MNPLGICSRVTQRVVSRPVVSGRKARVSCSSSRVSINFNFLKSKSVHTSSQQDNAASKLPAWGHHVGESAEYHRTSTRYTVSPPEVLRALDNKPQRLHFDPQTAGDKVSWNIVRLLRVVSDMYFKDDLINRAMMLETVAAVPGMVAGMTHHLGSLRRVQHDNWIKTLLDEAENERMHLMTFMELHKPTVAEKMLILAVQGIVWNMFFFSYLFTPRYCHRFVGFLEEEAVKTYTHFLELIDSGKIKNVPAPDVAKKYWGLPETATLRDVVLVIRADEMDHRDVNHTMSNYLIKHKSSGEFAEINIKASDLYTADFSSEEAEKKHA